jgi:exodeoxyribonuclease VII large subunit
MWRNSALKLRSTPREGDAVEVHGSIDLYEAGGQYQLYADQIRPFGEGVLFREFLLLKEKLEAEGLFAQERKRTIPRWPKTIGLVTSPTGAALRDIINTIRRRYPLVEVVLSPTLVQGEDAPDGIVKAIENLNHLIQPDVILVARGGGSIEDLWAFNDERVARVIADSTAPIITGIGHETDFTIADFVSDLRAPTPTASAELATPNKPDLLDWIDDLHNRQARALSSFLSEQMSKQNRLLNRLKLASPRNWVISERQRTDELSSRFQVQMDHLISLQVVKLSGLAKQLDSLNPDSVLRRGYAIVSNRDGVIISSVNQVQIGDWMNIHVTDGNIPVNVTDRNSAGK